MRRSLVVLLWVALFIGSSGNRCRNDSHRSLTGKTGEVRILVVSDGLTSKAKHKNFFKDHVANVRAAYLALPGVDPKVNLNIRENYKEETNFGDSRFGLIHTGDPAKCYFKFGGSLNKIADLEKNFNAHYYVVVFGAVGGGGCAKNKMVFIVTDTTRRTVKHEMGHAVGGLYDERGSKSGSSKVNEANCSTHPKNTPWVRIVSSPAVSGCDEYDELWHPTETCIMISPANTKDFCDVCENLLKTVNQQPPPGPPAFTEQEGLDVTAVIDSAGHISVVSAVPVDKDALAAPVINGNAFVVAFAQFNTPAQRIVAVAPLSFDHRDDDLLQGYQSMERKVKLIARSYPPRGGEERRVQVDSTLVRFTLYGVTKQNAARQKLALQIRTLENPGRASFVTSQTRERLAVPPFVQPVTFDLQSALMPQLNVQ